MTIPNAENPQSLSVDELISLILGGRTELYQQIVRRYQHDVLQIVSGLLYDRGPTEDLVQEVFVNAYFALSRFQPGSDFRPWIRTIARNAVREQLRKQSRYDRRLKTYGRMLEARLADDRRAALDERVQTEALQRCMGRLSQRQATAIRLRYTDGKSNREIAAIMGTSDGAIRNLLCGARAALRGCLEREVNQP